jgi:beta-mannosidase
MNNPVGLGSGQKNRPIPTEAESALVMVRVEASRFALDDKRQGSGAAGSGAAGSEGALKAEIRLGIPGEKKPILDETILLNRPGSAQDGTAYYIVANPRLWWTHDLAEQGTPFLYDLKVTLRKGKEVLDVHEQQVGIRTLALDQSPDPDEPGTRFFRFVLNGLPIFARGANWIPADSFVGAIPDEPYQRLLTMTRDANMNMLRVWGGGIYEHDVFYRLCDRLGLLVWQDFMFACAMYPENDAAYVAEVEAEARYQVRRLRSHPSLAIWCGNNENQWIHDRNNPEHPERKVPGSLYYDQTLPEAVQALDGVTPYWPSSPYGGNDYNSMEDGDRHNWWVWHGGLPRRFGEPVINDRSPAGVSYRHYAEDSGRFISEFGMHAAPVFETLRRVIPEDQRYHHSPSMDHHNKDNPKNKGDNLMETVTGLPRDLDEYIDFSMIAQAEGLKFGIEHFRRRKPHCSGALFWQLNDCWPVLSWSLVDYYGFGKAGYFYAKRVFAPVLASFREEENGQVSLWITSDCLDDFEDTITVRWASFTGKIFWEKQIQVNVPANSSVEIERFDPQPGLGDRYLAVRSAGERFPANRHFAVAIKDLQREPVKPAVTVQAAAEGALEVSISAPAYVYFFHLTHPSEFTRYSDNYFDLEPGETRTIKIWNEKGPLKAEEVEFSYR